MKIDVIERRIQEAIIRGCEYIGDAVGEYTAKYQYGSYKLACGHIQDIKRVHFLKGKYRCKQCLLDKYAQEAGATWLIITNHRPLEHDADYKQYRLLCGHEKIIAHYSLSKSTEFCAECDYTKKHEDAQRVGLELLNYSDTSDWMKRKYKFSKCGHVQDILLQRVAKGDIPKCNTCQEEQWYKEAADVGIEILGLESRKLGEGNTWKCLYRLSCGCEKWITRGDVRIGNFGCVNHSNYWNKPSVLYILKIQSLGFTWVKVGVSSNIKRRIQEYKIHNPFEVLSEEVITFPSLAEATKIEKRFHKKFKYLRIEPKLMKGYMQNGTTECYPVEHFELLKKELWGFCE